MPTRMDWIASFRNLRHKPLYTVTIALALGIGVAAVTVVFSWFEGLFFRPLPGVPESRSLQVFELHRVDSSTTAFSYPDYKEMADGVASSMDVAAYSMARITLSGAGKPKAHWALFVSGNFFSLMGQNPSAGRLLRTTDNAAEQVVVLSHEFWQTHFQGDPAIVGRTAYVDGHAVRIVGVTSPVFQGPYTGLSLGMYLPLSIKDALEGGSVKLDSRSLRSLTLSARLKPGVTPEHASQTIDVVVRGLDQASPRGNFDQAKVVLTPMWRSSVGAQAIVGPIMIALGGVVLIVLLLACVNAAGVMLIENSSRRRELSIRLSLGAGAGAIIRYRLAEAVLLSVLAAGVGLFLASAASDHLQDLAPDLQFPIKITFPIDGPVLGFAILAAGIAAGFCGLWSGLEAKWQATAVALRAETSNVSAPRERSRLRAALIGAQIALSFILLSGSALFYRSVEHARALELGFDPRSVSLIRIDLSSGPHNSISRVTTLRTALSRILETPGVSGASLATSAPLELANQERVSILADRDAEPAAISVNRIFPGYFTTLGIPLVAGRDFSESDRRESSPVAIVNEALAIKLWKSAVPLGRSFIIGGRRYAIVGIVRNTKIWSLTQEAQPYLYLPLLQSDFSFAVMHVKSRMQVGAVQQIVERELERLDPSLPVASAQLMTNQVESALFPQRIALVMLTIFSIAGVYLAAIGLYGAVAHAAQSRTKELAIRLALGATAANVCGLVVRQAAVVVGLGLFAGFALSMILNRFLQAVVTGVGGADAVSMIVPAAAICVVALVATCLPALRSTRLETASVLRVD
jgi:putative ABC transport system permease protein